MCRGKGHRYFWNTVGLTIMFQYPIRIFVKSPKNFFTNERMKWLELLSLNDFWVAVFIFIESVHMQRSTVSQILALRRIIEGIHDKNLTAVMTFIDFKKVFDMVHSISTWSMVECYRVILWLPTCKVVLDYYCLRSAINRREEHLGFTVNPRRSRRVGPGPLMVTHWPWLRRW